MEVKRINPNASRRNAHYNLLLFHRYCRNKRDAEFLGVAGVCDKRQ